MSHHIWLIQGEGDKNRTLSMSIGGVSRAELARMFGITAADLDPDAELARIEEERGAQDTAFLALAGGARQGGQVAQAGGANGQAPADVLAGELAGAGANGRGVV